MTSVMDMTLDAKRAPMKGFFSQDFYDLEQKTVFANAPQYVGHQLMIPSYGDYYTLEHENHARVLVHTQEGPSLVSNICRHNQAIMLKGKGNARHISCPLHRWAYDLHGRQTGAPYFQKNPCRNLQETKLTMWNGMAFAGNRNVAKDMDDLPLKDILSFDGYKLDRVSTVSYDYNWKIFIEVYLDDYHIDQMHPGLGKFVDCRNLGWHFAESYNLQTVGLRSSLSRSGSKVYSRWHDAVLRQSEGAMPPYGAVWMLYYPNIMIEWQPHALLISTVIPVAPEKCLNVVEYYYPEAIMLHDRDFIEAHQQAYEETAMEDEEICLRMADGRRALYLRGEEDFGPKQSPMEDGMEEFHRYFLKALDDTGAANKNEALLTKNCG